MVRSFVYNRFLLAETLLAIIIIKQTLLLATDYIPLVGNNSNTIETFCKFLQFLSRLSRQI